MATDHLGMTSPSDDDPMDTYCVWCKNGVWGSAHATDGDEFEVAASEEAADKRARERSDAVRRGTIEQETKS